MIAGVIANNISLGNKANCAFGINYIVINYIVKGRLNSMAKGNINYIVMSCQSSHLYT